MKQSLEIKLGQRLTITPQLQQAIKLRPEDPSIMDTLGWIYYKMGYFNRSIGLLEKALSNKDAKHFKDAAHSLRSSANHVGASRMVKMLLELRDIDSAALKDYGKDAIDSLRSEFAKVRTRLDQELGNRGKGRSQSR